MTTLALLLPFDAVEVAPTLWQRTALLWQQAVDVWRAGGWCMLPIAVTALLMFGIGIHIHLRLRAKGFSSVPESVWRRYVEHPVERQGPIGRLIHAVSGARTLRQLGAAFQELRVVEVAPFERDLKLMRVCVGAAPLLGLLGTVTGMLATFHALAHGSGGDKTMALVAKGISEALITTETGLVVALPGVFFQYQLGRRCERYRTFLAHLETVCTQHMFRRLQRRAASA